MQIKKKLNRLNKVYIFFFSSLLIINCLCTNSIQASSFQVNNLEISDQGLVSLGSNVYKYQTSNPKFFAGGDMIIGSSLAVHAIAHGRDAAKEIINYLIKP